MTADTGKESSSKQISHSASGADVAGASQKTIKACQHHKIVAVLLSITTDFT